MDQISCARVKNKSAKQGAERQLANGNNIQKNTNDAKQVSAGVLERMESSHLIVLSSLWASCNAMTMKRQLKQKRQRKSEKLS